MAETLLLWFNRFTDDPSKVQSRLNGRPVLMYEPPDQATAPDDEDSEEYQFKTQSGLAVPVIGGGEPMACIVEKTKENAFKQRVTIGRTNNNDVVLEDSSVSRFHAYLEQANGEWVLVDAGSRNGSFVAGRKLPGRTPTSLTNGSALRIGAVQLTFFTAVGFVEMLKRRAAGK
jgi:hypothetical protein